MSAELDMESERVAPEARIAGNEEVLAVKEPGFMSALAMGSSDNDVRLGEIWHRHLGKRRRSGIVDRSIARHQEMQLCFGLENHCNT